jgi:hypothetical protein
MIALLRAAVERGVTFSILQKCMTSKTLYRSERSEAIGLGEKVHKPDIQNQWDNLYKKPGYEPF